MIAVMRNKFGPYIIGSIVAVIAAVFIFYGVFVPGQGAGGSGAAGEVNHETISYSEFSRALNQRTEYLRTMLGGKISEEQLEQFNLREAVFQDLVQRKIMVQMARKEGFYPSIEEIRDQIVKMDVFKKDGRFDKVLYKSVLSQNSYSPTRFEELIGQDLMEQNFRSYLLSLASVSADQVERELRISNDKRKFKYAFIDRESVRKLLPTAPKDILKAEEQNKIMDKKVDDLVAQLQPNLSGKTSIKVKTTDWITSQTEMIPEVGSIHAIREALFALKKGQTAQRFSLVGGTLVAQVADAQVYDPSKVTAKEKAQVTARLQNQKQNEVFGVLMKSWMSKASISRNDSLISGKAGASQPMPGAMDN